MKKPTKILLQLALYGIAIYAIIAYSAVRYPLEPALEATPLYERNYVAIGGWPFVTSYLLYKPVDYDPTRKYPLVLSLHGASKRSYEAFYLAQDAIQQKRDCFVLVPMAPPYRPWASTDGRIAALTDAMDMLGRVLDTYTIDQSRIYVTGHSMGAVGTFAAMAHYAHIFAAGVAVNGYWTVDDAEKLAGTKLWVFHGEDDKVFPLERTQDLFAAIKATGGSPRFTLMKGIGHRSQPAYDDPAVWDWLFGQRLGG